MQFNRRRIVFVKLSVIALAVFSVVCCFLIFPAKSERTLASASGPSASHTNAPNEDNCTTCHTSFPVNSGAGGVSISDLPVNYLPNQQIPVTVTVNQSNAVIYGFQLTAIDSLGQKVGTYTIPAQSPAQIKTVTGIVAGNQRLYVEHTVDGVIPTVFGTKSWTFTWNAPARRVGKVSFYAAGNAANSDGTTNGDYIYTTAKSTLSGTAISNFDGDGRSDIAVYRPSTGVWFSLKSRDGFNATQFGTPEDKPVTGDYDGDGKTDFAVYRPSNGVWYLLKSSDGSFQAVQFGTMEDKPIPADYDGDGKTDLAVYRPSSGVWYLLQSTRGFSATQFGNQTDKPVPADYDADGKTDLAVYRPSNGVWYLLKSSDGFAAVQFGDAADKPIPSDYDGDGKSDLAVYRPSSGVWYFLNSRSGFSAMQFGNSTDKPVPADYDGDGKTDLAVYRPADGNWFIIRSSDNSFYTVNFGNNQDIPIPSGLLPE